MISRLTAHVTAFMFVPDPGLLLDDIIACHPGESHLSFCRKEFKESFSRRKGRG
jgi:hypothetical protein